MEIASSVILHSNVKYSKGKCLIYTNKTVFPIWQLFPHAVD